MRGFDSGALMITPHCDLLDGICVGERAPWRILQRYICAETNLHTSRSIRSLFFFCRGLALYQLDCNRCNEQNNRLLSKCQL